MAPGDVHADAAHNIHDVHFLNNMAGSLAGTSEVARAAIAHGEHPEVQATARAILGQSTDAMATVDRLVNKLGLAAPGGTSSTSSTSGHAGNSTGNVGQGGGDGGGRSGSLPWEERAVLTGAGMDALPDSAFAYIEPGGSKDTSGRTVPRSKRHFPIHDAAHVRNALARAPQSPFGKQAMPAIMAAAKKFGIDTSQDMNSREPGAATYRSVPFQVQRTGDGLTLEGYAAVFNSPTRISSWEGDFEEVITPGAFANSLRNKAPVLMFEHGRHPLIGSMPLGVITRAQEDAKGLHIEARLSDNWLIQPVRDAVRDGAVTGMSFRFSVPEGGDKMVRRSGDVDLRTINQADVAELGPVVFPAYEPTTASIRSLMERLPEIVTGRPDAWSAGGGEPVPPPYDFQQRFDTDSLHARGILR